GAQMRGEALEIGAHFAMMKMAAERLDGNEAAFIEHRLLFRSIDRQAKHDSPHGVTGGGEQLLPLAADRAAAEKGFGSTIDPKFTNVAPWGLEPIADLAQLHPFGGEFYPRIKDQELNDGRHPKPQCAEDDEPCALAGRRDQRRHDEEKERHRA